MEVHVLFILSFIILRLLCQLLVRDSISLHICSEVKQASVQSNFIYVAHNNKISLSFVPQNVTCICGISYDTFVTFSVAIAILCTTIYTYCHQQHAHIVTRTMPGYAQIMIGINATVRSF